MALWEDEKRGGGGRGQSGRIGSHGGQASRTFHAHFSSVKAAPSGSGGSAASAIDYLERAGDFQQKAEDLEHVAGNSDDVKEAAQAIDNGVRIRNGPTAERILVKQTFELPADLDAKGRAEVADQIVQDWQDRGHQAVAAVHANGKVQPHIHVAVTARPVEKTKDGWQVDRSPERRIMADKAAVRAERQRVAETINTVTQERAPDAPQFFPGRDNQMDQPGIQGRSPKVRIPQRQWHVENQRGPNAELVRTAHNRHEKDRDQAKRLAETRKVEKERKTAEKLRKKDLVPGQKARAEVEKAKRAAKPLTPEQRQMFQDRGIDLPPDIDRNSEAQSAAYKKLREETKQAEKRAEKKGLEKGADRGAAFAKGLADLERERGPERQRKQQKHQQKQQRRPDRGFSR